MAVAKPRHVGLARALSKLGFCSRSRAFKLIRAGKVQLNKRVQRDPEYPVDFEKDRIKVEDRLIEAADQVYLMLNKPRGVVTTASDEKGRANVYANLPSHLPWVGPVGRLDKASEGLLLLTNDSEWAARILAPETHLTRTYHVRVKGDVSEACLKSIRDGVQAKEGDILRARNVSVIRQGERKAWLEIILDEGRNRHIRRMLAALDVEVLRLIRIAIGPLQLGDLAKGASRRLTAAEKQGLDRDMRAVRPGSC
jgi:23S rRNA pseudouridine2605 synthase